MFTIAVCDDNPMFAKLLAQRIRTLCALQLSEDVECHIETEFGSAHHVLTYLKNNPLNVLFLDIDMPGVNGFELASVLNKSYPDILIVFVSAYDDFVYSSFEYSPFRFLRKSRLNQELPDTIQKIIQKCLADTQVHTFASTEGDVVLRVKDICLIEGERNYYAVKMVSGETYHCRGTISSVTESLKQFQFYRVHISFLINMEHISKFDDRYGIGTVTMSDGTQVSISRRNMAEFKKEYMAFSRRRITR